MKARIKKHLDQVLSHLYINPLEKCNLHCKICYTRKTAPILSEKQIIDFIERYKKVKKLQTITFCGGEVFTLKYFPALVNKLTSEDSGRPYRVNTSFARMTKNRIFVQIITNGTIDRLSEFENPNMVNLIVSLDGLPHYHDANRGLGNFEKSIGFLQKAHKSGFHTEVFSIVTRQNLKDINKFEEYINLAISGSRIRCGMTEKNISITYHPRKPPSYLLHHPDSNIFGKTAGFDFLTENGMIKIMKERRTFPPKNLGCYQIALVSDGRVFGCCEGTIPIGRMENDIEYLIDKLKERIVIWEKTNPPTGGLKNCLGCSQSDFMCGIKKYVNVILGTQSEALRTPESDPGQKPG